MNKDLQILDTCFENTISSITNFMRSQDAYKFEIGEFAKDYSIENAKDFNIFTAFSDSYYKENLHSDILKLLFDPKTPKIGNAEFLNIFIGVINKIQNKNIHLDLNSVTVEREKGRIDIFIHDNSNGIIIENKINNAGDRENQIGRYYKKAADRKIKVKSIVYLTLSPEKKLDRDYSIQDSENREAIEKLILELPVIGKKGNICFVNDVIDQCIPLAKNTLAEVFLTEYSNLLKYLGGTFMCGELDKKAMFEIFNDEEALNSFRVMGNLWDNRDGIIANVIKDYFRNELKFKTHSGDPENAVYKPIKEGVNIGYDTGYSFGFVNTPGTPRMNADDRKKFKGLMADEKLLPFFTDDKAIDEGYWVYKTIDHAKINSLKDLKKLVNIFEEIIKEKL
jgi:hypothetical protein